MNPRIVAFIFARGGSKGLPRKNLLMLAGKPLIVHSIDIALNLSRISRVVVSTDDEEIASVARDAGAEVPFIRPSHLAQDTTPEWLAWQHAVSWLRAAGDRFELFLSLPPTSPLRIAADVDCCLDQQLSTNADVVISVRAAERSPYFNMVKQRDDGTMQLAVEGNFHRRQDAPVLYDITTVAYVARADFIIKAQRLFEGTVRAVEVPRERALDIDTELDLSIGRALIGSEYVGRQKSRAL